jgi:hypothetical protein
MGTPWGEMGLPEQLHGRAKPSIEGHEVHEGPWGGDGQMMGYLGMRLSIGRSSRPGVNFETPQDRLGLICRRLWELGWEAHGLMMGMDGPTMGMIWRWDRPWESRPWDPG